jgi:hypothetical protein
MVAERVIHVEPGSEIDRMLSEAEERPIVLEWHGRKLRIVQDSIEQKATYDPDRVRESILGLRGIFQGLDVEAFKKEILEEREQDSIGRPR